MRNHGKILVFSIVETVALALWLSISGALGLVVAAVGLSIEHWFSHNTGKGRGLLNTRGVPFGKIIGFSVSETAIWALWLVLLNAYGAVPAAIVLTALLIPQHKVELNVFEGKPLLSELVSSRTLGISVVEGIGGTLWGVLALASTTLTAGLVAVLVLLITMQIEHELQASLLERV